MDTPTPAPTPTLAAWRARLSGRTGAVVAGVCGVAVAVVAVVLLFRQPFGPPAPLTLPRAGDPPASGDRGATVAGPGVASAGPAGAAGSGASVPGTTPAVVTVHAAGAVARPGIYALPTGARVADLLTAAGGPAPEADLDRLNLAARVSDGERISVARKGDPDPPAGSTGETASGGPGGAGNVGGTPAGAAGPLDLNSATAEQLDGLPGVGPATARSIITYRQRHGRFRSVTELLEVPGIGPTKMEALRPLVKV
ncbi:MAG: helix-hairpin-helix domain-containing protein [Actinomycetota bacterium]|nr:helix-hairpin-helix domain-containing protein [Actinomycetota bacterium]